MVPALVKSDDDKLRPGMYVYAHLTEQLPEAWTVPVTAVVKQGDKVILPS